MTKIKIFFLILYVSLTIEQYIIVKKTCNIKFTTNTETPNISISFSILYCTHAVSGSYDTFYHFF